MTTQIQEFLDQIRNERTLKSSNQNPCLDQVCCCFNPHQRKEERDGGERNIELRERHLSVASLHVP